LFVLKEDWKSSVTWERWLPSRPKLGWRGSQLSIPQWCEHNTHLVNMIHTYVNRLPPTHLFTYPPNHSPTNTVTEWQADQDTPTDR